MFRPADRGDLAFVHALHMHAEVNPFLSYDPMTIDEFEPLFVALLRDSEFLLYEERPGQPLGTAQVRRGSERLAHSVHVGGIAVLPECWGQGVGTRLLAELVARLHGEGFSRIELTVPVDNPRAIAVYEKSGFVREGTMRGFYSRAGRPGFFDEHLMALVSGSPPGAGPGSEPPAEPSSSAGVGR